jgi:hypothetical protein
MIELCGHRLLPLRTVIHFLTRREVKHNEATILRDICLNKKRLPYLSDFYELHGEEYVLRTLNVEAVWLALLHRVERTQISVGEGVLTEARAYQ